MQLKCKCLEVVSSRNDMVVIVHRESSSQALGQSFPQREVMM
jgi:hypothetical protein